jgi:hypothetical protein
MAQRSTNQPAVDDFDDPQTEYVTPEDYDGRTVLVYPKTVVDNLPSTIPGNSGTYSRVTADVVVVDGPVTEKIPSVPFVIRDAFLSGDAIVSRVRANIGTGKPVLGRIDSRPSTANRKIQVYGIVKVPADDPVRETAVKARDMYRDAQAASVGDDPFGPTT